MKKRTFCYTNCLLFFVLLFTFNPNALNAQSSIEASGEITSNTYWMADTVRVTGDINIRDSVTLTIEPGTRVEFQGYYRFQITGTLLAIGQPGDSIVFTIYDTTGFAAAQKDTGAWAGIWVDDSHSTGSAGGMDDNDSSIISYCKIEYIKAQSFGGVTIRFHDRMRISDSKIQFCKAPQGGGLHLRKAHVNIINNVIANNFGEFYAGGIYAMEFDGHIINNYIHSNSGNSAGGGLYIRGPSYPHVNGNIIANNYAQTGGGVYFMYADIIMQNNLIVNNAGYWTGGIYLYSSNVEIINNTISNNSSDAQGGGIYSSQSNLNLVNTILWGNTSRQGPQFLTEGIGSSNFYYCAVQGGKSGINDGGLFEGEYMNNIETYPKFENRTSISGITPEALTADWSLKSISPCINAGSEDDYDVELPVTDITGGERIQNNRVDIGAYEYHIKFINACGVVDTTSTWTADTVKIYCDVYIPDSVTLTIDHGTVVEFHGHYQINVSGILKALGIPGDSILFTVKDTNGLSNTAIETGGWEGIYINTSSQIPDTSIISHCILEYGKKTSTSTPPGGGALHIAYSPKVKIINCDIRYNYDFTMGGGIYISSSKTTVKNTVFRNNYSLNWGGGLYLYNLTKIDFSNNYFKGNSAGNSGGGMYSQNSKITLKNSTFYQNTASYGGGVGLALSKAIVSKCRLFNNQASTEGGGLYLPGADKSSNILNCVIANNSAPEGGAISQGEPIVTNSTITQNSSGYMNWTETPSLVNTILWNNGDYEMKFFAVYARAMFSNCIIMGDSSAFIMNSGRPFDDIGYFNNMDTIPEFVNPSDGIGAEFDGMSANWSISPFSPCINKGTMDITLIDDKDFLGNPRINGQLIDIGAVENQAVIPAITVQPANKYACIGEMVEFNLKTADTCRYQWQKNGLVLPGETNRKLTIDPVTFDDEASYNCLVSNNYGNASSNIVLLIVRSKPQVVNQLGDTWVTNTGKTRLEALATGTQPITYQWLKDGNEIPDADHYYHDINNDNPENQGTYICKLNNLCGETISDSVRLFMAPQICMVTVSTATGNNLIIWEKISKAPLLAYNVYRESQSAGIYDLLGSVSADDLSVFTDSTADPTSQAYLYKITALDTANNETDADLCKVHKTVHLLVSTNPELNTTQLQWDNYFGFAYNTYSIYRSVTGFDFTNIKSLSSSLNSWTDSEVITGDLFYRIAVERPDPCYPEGGEKKAGTGPYHHSLSNMDDNKLKSGSNPPDSVWLDNKFLDENNMIGALVGRLNTRDADTSDVHTYRLVSGPGDEDNISFTLIGDLLVAASRFDFESKDTLNIRIRTSDRTDNYFEYPLQILINDLDENVGFPTLKAQYLQVYPNPFSGSASILFPNQEGQEYSFFVTNLEGKTVRSAYGIKSNTINFKQEELPAGIYFIELRGPKNYRGRMVIE